MFRTVTARLTLTRGFPRASGDVSLAELQALDEAAFSPRERGCSRQAKLADSTGHVFPARAGMFPLSSSRGTVSRRFPRASGDVPHQNLVQPNQVKFSPRERGCSYGVEAPWSGLRVFPARAGMFR